MIIAREILKVKDTNECLVDFNNLDVRERKSSSKVVSIENNNVTKFRDTVAIEHGYNEHTIQRDHNCVRVTILIYNLNVSEIFFFHKSDKNVELVTF